jgi:hypothetical protein
MDSDFARRRVVRIENLAPSSAVPAEDVRLKARRAGAHEIVYTPLSAHH